MRKNVKEAMAGIESATAWLPDAAEKCIPPMQIERKDGRTAVLMPMRTS